MFVTSKSLNYHLIIHFCAIIYNIVLTLNKLINIFQRYHEIYNRQQATVQVTRQDLYYLSTVCRHNASHYTRLECLRVTAPIFSSISSCSMRLPLPDTVLSTVVALLPAAESRPGMAGGQWRGGSRLRKINTCLKHQKTEGHLRNVNYFI